MIKWNGGEEEEAAQEALISTDYLGFMKPKIITKYNNTTSFTRDQSISPNLNLFQFSSLQHPGFLVKIKGNILFYLYLTTNWEDVLFSLICIHNAWFVSCFTDYSDSVLSFQPPRKLNNFIFRLPTKHNILISHGSHGRSKKRCYCKYKLTSQQ